MEFNISNYPGKYVMHCKTKEEAEDFCNHLDSVGKTWRLGDRYLNNTRFETFKEKTAYDFHQGTWTEVDFYKKEGYTILEWSDFMKKKQFTKADLKNGDVILRRNEEVEIYNSTLDMCISKCSYNDLDSVDNNLTHQFNNEWDVIAVRRPKAKYECSFNAFNLSYGDLVYERKEVEEMTLEQVCKLLGKEIKIIK